MTIEDAQRIISNYDLNFQEVNGKLFTADEIASAFDIAIRSLEAWENVKAEIEASINFANESVEEAIYKCGVESALEIIDKHLKGVSDE